MTTHRAMPPVYFLVSLLAMAGLHVFFPGVQLTESRARFAGILFIVLGGWLAASGSRLFDKYNTPVRPFEVSTKLVTEGPYRYSRNPMYLGLVIVMVGVAIIFSSLTPIIAVPVFVWLMTTRFVVHEEKALASQFGQAYTDYCRSVRRWL